VSAREQFAAGLIGSDFLGFPVSNMGTGLGGTAGVAIARPIGDFSVGAGASVRYSARYEPFASGGAPLRYQPGNEYRARVGADHALGTGRVTLGLTYSTFANDDLGGSIYNTGDRVLAQVEATNTVGAGNLTLVAWALLRSPGTLADGSSLGRENIASMMAGYGVRVRSVRVEPTLELRTWTQADARTSVLTSLGIGVQCNVAGMTIAPSAGYAVGRLAAQDTAAHNVTAPLAGLRALLTIRLR